MNKILVKCYYSKTGKLIPFKGDSLGTESLDGGFVTDLDKYKKLNKTLDWNSILTCMINKEVYKDKPSYGMFYTYESIL